MGKNHKIRFEEEAYEQILDALEFVSRVSAQAAERLSEEIIEQTKNSSHSQIDSQSTKIIVSITRKKEN